MLWFKFILGLKFFKPVGFLFSFVSDYGNENQTKENKNPTGLKNFKPKINLNHNIYNLFAFIALTKLCANFCEQGAQTPCSAVLLK